MGSTGRGITGQVYTGKGSSLPPSFQEIGTGSGLTVHGVLIAEGTSAFEATAAGATGTVLMGNTGANPSFQTGGTTFANTITGDSGGALSPSSGNWDILGLSGSKTSGSGSTLTIKAPPFSQVGGSGTSVLNTGEFVTATATRTLPASAGLADGDLFIFYATTANVLTIQAVGTQKIRLGNTLSSAAGSIASTAAGDSVTMRFDATQGFFMVVSSMGNWVVS